MKIGLVSTPFFGVPPPSYGGLERIVYDLWQGLLDRGHKVVCFSPDPTQTPEGGYHHSTGKAVTTVNTDWVKTERDMIQQIEQYFPELDVIHEHNWLGHCYASKVKYPQIKVCHTHHGGMNWDWWKKSPPPFKLNLIAISNWMRSVYETGGFPAQTCYNGIDLDQYPYKAEKDYDRLMFLGRIDPIKAPHHAIDVVKQTGDKLDIIGGTTFVADQNYVNTIKTISNVSGSGINFIGEVDHKSKILHLQNAKALLIPSQFGEPFGLVCVEAMACGTVPIALNDGALSEIIEDGKSGFICDSLDEMVKAVGRIDEIDPKKCRERAERFSKEVLAERMEFLYQQILEGYEW